MAETACINLPDGLLELRDLLKAEWPARRAALRASGVPLNEGDDPPPVPPAPTDPPTPADPPAPAPPAPWGDDFDAQRAWDTIQAQRKKERDLETRLREFEDAQKTDQQKLEERATSAEQAAESATREAARLRVAMKKGLTDTMARRLVGDTEEELEADADELLAALGTTDDDDGDDPLDRRPTPRLRPGAVPASEPEETDPRALAAKVPRRY